MNIKFDDIYKVLVPVHIPQPPPNTAVESLGLRDITDTDKNPPHGP